MHNNVTSALARSLAAKGVMALRFNFRGAGRSDGQHDGGRGEQVDVAGALDWLLAQSNVDPWRVALVGYSFGAWVGLAHAQHDPRVAAVAAVGLVAWRYDVDFGAALSSAGGVATWSFDADFLQSFSRPKLLITGEYDAFAPPGKLQSLAERLPPPKAFHVIPGGDHFLLGREQEVGDLVAEFVASL